VEVRVPDPAFTRSARARANFRLAIRIALVLAALLWVVQLVNVMLDLDPGDLGVRPRTPGGLVGILTAPLAHGDFAHLLANSPAIVVLGTVMLTLYPKSAVRVLPAVYLLPGVAVWLFGQAGTTHVGASGLVYGLAAYVFVAGIIRRDRRAIAASMLVAFMYGALVWGLVPIRPRLSWETHLAAAIVGVAMALVLRHLDPVPVVRYAWEGEDDWPDDRRGLPGTGDDGSAPNVPDDGDPAANPPAEPRTPPPTLH
jgi:membrane associated rhomboid family serine protease